MIGNMYYVIANAVNHLRENITDKDALDYDGLFLPWSVDVEYQVGDRISYDGTLYKCLTAHTSQDSWTPPESPSLWVRVDDPSIEWPDWVQPTGSTDAYAKDAKVSHNGKHWTSDVDGNVWEPGIAMWTEAE